MVASPLGSIQRLLHEVATGWLSESIDPIFELTVLNTPYWLVWIINMTAMAYSWPIAAFAETTTYGRWPCLQ